MCTTCCWTTVFYGGISCKFDEEKGVAKEWCYPYFVCIVSTIETLFMSYMIIINCHMCTLDDHEPRKNDTV